jgi:TolA-binding protein
MSDKKYSENDPERTLITLDQLSQTIEVMTSVVNRLRQHLSEQVLAKRDLEALEQECQQQSRSDPPGDADACNAAKNSPAKNTTPQSVVVEVSKPDSALDEIPDEKTLH